MLGGATVVPTVGTLGDIHVVPNLGPAANNVMQNDPSSGFMPGEAQGQEEGH
jgi:hypothetical protein